MKKQTLVVLVVLVSLILVIGSSGLFESLLTSFSLGFSRKAFLSIKEGDTLSKVYKELGPPLDFTVIPYDANVIPNNPLRRTNMKEMFEFALNGRDSILMRYSGPKRKQLDNYKAYEIVIRGDRIVQKSSYWYRD